MNHYEKTQKLNDVDFKQIIGVKRQLLRDDGGFDRGVSKEARKNLAAHRERRICGMPRTVENAAMTCADVRVSDATRAAEPRVRVLYRKSRKREYAFRAANWMKHRRGNGLTVFAREQKSAST